MPRPRSLSPAALANAALEIVDREGLASLSMRTLAGELGVTAMSLYRYVSNKAELERLVVEAILQAIDTQSLGEGAWRDRLAILVERAWRAMRVHPAVVPLVLTRRQNSPSALRWGEAVMRALAEGGFRGKQRAIAFRTLLSYLIGAVQVEHFGPLSGAGTAMLASLPVDKFPHLADTARRAQRIDPEDEFLTGLERVIEGLVRSARKAKSARRRAGT